MTLRLERLRPAHLFGFVAVYAVGFIVVFAAPARSAPMMTMASTPRMTSSLSATSLRARFDYLSKQSTNSCMITKPALDAMPASGRLQGACCSAMGYADYSKQVSGIALYNRKHGTANVLETDPYNISVAFMRRLNSFNDQILLSRSQQQVYDKAFPLAKDKAPCCCHCYRWTAFEGQAKYLIARRRYTSKEVAEVWNLDDGCGSGNMGAGSGMGMGMGG